MGLLERFRLPWTDAACTGDPTAVHRALIEAWSEPHRRYHDIRHLGACLALFDEVRHLAARPAEVELALWFHDAVYDTNATDNERRSADWARRALLDGGAPTEVAGRVAELVVATAHTGEGSNLSDAALLNDIDLAILGSDTEAFAAYEAGVREEYGWVEDEAFARARVAILRRLLARAPLYATKELRERFETSARANLERAIVQWGMKRGA